MNVIVCLRTAAYVAVVGGCLLVVTATPPAESITTPPPPQAAEMRPIESLAPADLDQQLAESLAIAQKSWQSSLGDAMKGIDADVSTVLSSIVHRRFDDYDAFMAARGASLGPLAANNADSLREYAYRDDDAVCWSGDSVKEKVRRLWETPQSRRAEWLSILPDRTTAGYHSVREESLSTGGRGGMQYLTIYEFPNHVALINDFQHGKRKCGWISVWARFKVEKHLIAPEELAFFEGKEETDPIEIRLLFVFDEGQGKWIPVFARSLTPRGTPRILI